MGACAGQVAAWRGRAAPMIAVAILVACCLPARTEGAELPQAAKIDGDAARGEELFGTLGCNGCHMVNAVGGQVGPNLSRVIKLDLARDRPGRTWPDVASYIRESLADPQAYIVRGFPSPSPMPRADQFGIGEQEVNDLIAYLASAAGRAKER